MSDERVTVETCVECELELDDCECCGYCGGECNKCYTCMDCVGDCYCVRCETCGTKECERNHRAKGRQGHSNKPPWEIRGDYKPPSYIEGDTDWKAYWPASNLFEHFDPVEKAADFYLLEGMASGVLFTPKVGAKARRLPSSSEDDEFFLQFNIMDEAEQAMWKDRRNVALAERIGNDPVLRFSHLLGQAQQALDEFVEYADPILVEYSHMAISGELRHHQAVGGRFLYGPGLRNAAWCGWRQLYENVGPQALDDARKLFLEYEDRAYGGEPWANCAEVLHGRLTGILGPNDSVNKRMFIDRVWTLEHNGGSFLNKVDWAHTNRTGFNIEQMKFILDAHAAEPTNVKVLVAAASDEVVSLVESFVEVGNLAASKVGVPLIVQPEALGTRKRCNYCASNPDKGHYFGCAVQQYYEKEPKKYNEKDFCSTYSEVLWGDYEWAKWHVDELFYDSKFNINHSDLYNTDSVVKVWVDVSMTFKRLDDSYQRFVFNADSTYKITLSELVDGSFNIVDFIKEHNHYEQAMADKLSFVNGEFVVDDPNIGKVYEQRISMGADLYDANNTSVNLGHKYFQFYPEQNGKESTIRENMDYSGTVKTKHFTVLKQLLKEVSA